MAVDAESFGGVDIFEEVIDKEAARGEYCCFFVSVLKDGFLGLNGSHFIGENNVIKVGEKGVIGLNIEEVRLNSIGKKKELISFFL